MIITKNLEIRIERRNITFYRNLGYILKINTSLTIPTEQLMKGAKNRIEVYCDICHKSYGVIYKDYLNSRKTYNFDTCNKCKFQKTKLTNNEKYGCDVPLGNKDVMEKYLKTNNERYGGNSSSCNQEVLDKQRTTRIEKRMEVPLGKSVSDFQKYRNKVDYLTRKIKKKFIENWNGYDYYDGEYIKDNFKLRFDNKSVPTIEHKVSVFDGFMNNISEIEIAKLENLAITKKGINSSRKNKDYKLFKNDFL